jgi:NTP pyrophosphatase (non-canonical NTP hydrolase)
MSYKKELTYEESENLIAFLTTEDRRQMNLLKLAEELAELSEVVLKYVNKADGNKPPVDKLTEEIGDVFFRSAVVIKQFDIEDPVLDRLDEKGVQLYEYYKDRIETTENAGSTN